MRNQQQKTKKKERKREKEEEKEEKTTMSCKSFPCRKPLLVLKLVAQNLRL